MLTIKFKVYMGLSVPEDDTASEIKVSTRALNHIKGEIMPMGTLKSPLEGSKEDLRGREREKTVLLWALCE